MNNPTKFFKFIYVLIHLQFIQLSAQTNVIRSVEYTQISSFEINMEICNMKISSDGSRIVFATGGSAKKVFTINSDGTSLKLIYDFQNTGFGPFVDISADGSKIIWCDWVGEGEIFISNADGSSQEKIVTLLPHPDPNFEAMKPYVQLPPRITSDGSRVYFIHNHRDPQGTGVWRVNSDGSNLTQVFNFNSFAEKVYGRDVSNIWYLSFTDGFDISATGDKILVGTNVFKVEIGNYDIGEAFVFSNDNFYSLGEYAVGNQPFATYKNGDQFLVFRKEYNSELNNEEINVYFDPIETGSPIKVISGLNVFGTSAMTQMAGDGSIAIVQSNNGRLPITLVDRATSSCCDLVSIDGISINALGGFRFSESILPSINWNGDKFCFLAQSNPPQIWIGEINSDGVNSVPSISEIEFSPNFVLIDGSTTSIFKAHLTSAPNTIHTATFETFKNGQIKFRALKSGWPYNGFLIDNGEFGDTQAGDGYYFNNSICADLPETPIGDYTIRFAAINSTLRKITSVDVETFFILDEPNSISGEMNSTNNFCLLQNYPNPFNPTTTIEYSVPSVSVISNKVRNLKDYSSQTPRNDNVKLIVYDILGREIATLVNQNQKQGNYEIIWDASKYSNGIYYYKLNFGTFTQTRKMILLK
ncbi:MAG: hypothetical protein IPH62_10145 [Ignavibacteriae bacterium]|nr:hypothetical protein [Ignavibacteriota bacterium]